MAHSSYRSAGRFAAAARFTGAAIVASVATGAAFAAEVDPKADQVLKAMSDHLTSVASFAIKTETAADYLLRSGEKIQIVGGGAGLFHREKGFRFSRAGDLGGLEVVFDGSKATIHSAGANAFASIEVEGGVDEALDEIRHALGIEAAGGVDLLYSNPYLGLTWEIESGRYVGETVIDGQRAHHLAYRAAEVDWQIWVKAEGDPLPLRYVVTSKWVASAPQFAVSIRRFDPNPEIAPDAFAFAPAADASELDIRLLETLEMPQSE